MGWRRRDWSMAWVCTQMQMSEGGADCSMAKSVVSSLTLSPQFGLVDFVMACAQQQYDQVEAARVTAATIAGFVEFRSKQA